MSTHTGPRQGGWQQPVAVVDLDELHGPVEGTVQLPLRVYSSGLGPSETFDLADPGQRMALYQIVLSSGDEDALRRYINGAELRRLWPRLWLSPHVRRAWQPHISNAAAS
ncbi:MAG: hypothetical protein ACRDOY_03310 [Nocardioidaceae bacterium]